MNTATHTLVKTDISRKTAKYAYSIVLNETGETVGTRTSSRDYVACTIDGAFFFGRLDLIGKGDHGRMVKYYESEVAKSPEGSGHREVNQANLTNLTTIAIIK